MIIIEEIKAWKCKCGKIFESFKEADKHEDNCNYNPRLKGCMTCRIIRSYLTQGAGRVCDNLPYRCTKTGEHLECSGKLYCSEWVKKEEKI